jgi:hypothetical protein
VSARSGLSFQVAAESNSFELLRGLVMQANLISFQIRVGTVPNGNKLGLVARDIDDRDVPPRQTLGTAAHSQPAHSGGNFLPNG